MKKKLLVIGWDAADWKVIRPLMEAGKMPNFEKFYKQSSYGNLRTLDPAFSPMLWTSIATGKRADKHGIYGFIEPDPNDDTKSRPINSTSRKTRALWNILSHEKYKTNVVAWWPSQPVEPINGVMVSNYFHKNCENKGEDIVHPELLRPIFEGLDIPKDKITKEFLLNFVPNATKVTDEFLEKYGKLFVTLQKVTAETQSVFNYSDWVIKNTEWDFTATYFNAIDHYCHPFMKYHPPRMPHINEELFDMFSSVIDQAYIYHDYMLGELLKDIDNQTYVLLLSDHGFHSDHLRPKILPKFAASPALEHNPYGIFLLKGPDIKEDNEINGANLLDITPTLLTLLGLPVGQDMDGKVLTEVFTHEIKPSYLPSWDDIEGDFSEHSDDQKSKSYVGTEMMEQLKELGYVEDDSDNENKINGYNRAVNESKYNLSRVYHEKGDIYKTIDILWDLLDNQPEEIRFSIDLLSHLISLSDFDSADEVVKVLSGLKLEGIEKYYREVAIAKLEIAKGDYNLAEQRLDGLKKEFEGKINLNLIYGKLYRSQHKYEKAVGYYDKVLLSDPFSLNAYHCLTQCYLKLDKLDSAEENAIKALNIKPEAHYLHNQIAKVFKRKGDINAAIEAFEFCLKLAPNNTQSKLQLIKLYEESGTQIQRLEALKQELEEYQSEQINIVSGLPRSGTSLMMSILDKLEVPLLLDDKRKPDESNPKGYFEYEKTLTIEKTNKWMGEAAGKAVKVVAPLLRFVNNNYRYKIIFMTREIEDVLVSQEVMKKRLANKEEKITYDVSKEQKLLRFSKQVKKWLGDKENVEVLYVDHQDLLYNTEREVNKVLDFLGGNKDKINEAIQCVDLKLHRVGAKN